MTWRAFVAGAIRRTARRAKAEKKAAEKAANKAANEGDNEAMAQECNGDNEKNPAASGAPITEGGEKAPRG